WVTVIVAEVVPAVKLCGAVEIQSIVAVPLAFTLKVPLVALTRPSVSVSVRLSSATYAVTPLIVPVPALQLGLPSLGGHAVPGPVQFPAGAVLRLPESTAAPPRRS